MISVDTNILIWGLNRAASVDRRNMIPLAVRFFRYVATERIPIAIPSQALAEFLVRNTREERDKALELIEESFSIAPLDFDAAVIAAELSSDRAHCKVVRETFGVSRQCLKADINVLASSIAFGAHAVVTGDSKEFRSLAHGRIAVYSLEEYIEKIEAEAKPLNTLTSKPAVQRDLFGFAASQAARNNSSGLAHTVWKWCEAHPMRQSHPLMSRPRLQRSFRNK